MQLLQICQKLLALLVIVSYYKNCQFMEWKVKKSSGLTVIFLAERTMFVPTEIFLVQSQYTVEFPKDRLWGHYCLLFLSTTFSYFVCWQYSVICFLWEQGENWKWLESRHGKPVKRERLKQSFSERLNVSKLQVNRCFV